MLSFIGLFDDLLITPIFHFAIIHAWPMAGGGKIGPLAGWSEVQVLMGWGDHGKAYLAYPAPRRPGIGQRPPPVLAEARGGLRRAVALRHWTALEVDHAPTLWFIAEPREIAGSFLI